MKRISIQRSVDSVRGFFATIASIDALACRMANDNRSIDIATKEGDLVYLLAPGDMVKICTIQEGL